MHLFLDLTRAYGMNQSGGESCIRVVNRNGRLRVGDREKSHWRVALCHHVHSSDVDGLVAEREFARSHPGCIEKADQNWPGALD